jgi:hypothetical protein
MRQKQSPSESPGKGAVVVDKPMTRNQAKEAMARFGALTRDLLAVPRHRLQEEQVRYEKEKPKKPTK